MVYKGARRWSVYVFVSGVPPVLPPSLGNVEMGEKCGMSGLWQHPPPDYPAFFFPHLFSCKDLEMSISMLLLAWDQKRKCRCVDTAGKGCVHNQSGEESSKDESHE